METKSKNIINATKKLMRSDEKVRMIREEVKPDGTILVIDAYMPVGRGWNTGNGVLDWMNMPDCQWQTYDDYMDKKRQKEALLKAEMEVAEAKAEKELAEYALAESKKEKIVDNKQEKVKGNK